MAQSSKPREAALPPSRDAQIKTLIMRRYNHLVSTGSFRPGGRARALASKYPESYIEALPAKNIDAFSGCGFPLLDIDLSQFRSVLDIGCGAGVDSCFAAMEMSDQALVVAVDITESMLNLAMLAKKKLGLNSLNLLNADIDQLPVKTASMCLVIANATLNLSTEKSRTLAEIYRVLKPGGRFVARDLVLNGPLPDDLASDPMGSNTSLGGVIQEAELGELLISAGFINVKLSGHSYFPPVQSVQLDAYIPEL